MLILLSCLNVLFNWCYCEPTPLNPLDITITDSIRNDPDFQNSTFASMADRRGFVLLSYDVVSADNKFLITLHRLLDKTKTEADLEGRPPVICFAPLAATSQVYALDNRNESFAYIMYDKGYDVWLGNIRGNTYGRRFANGQPVSNQYKDWNHHVYDYAVYDATAQIDFVLSTTGQQKLRLVGMSQGTTISFHLLAFKPDYREKILAFVGMAPLLSVQHVTHPIIKAFLLLMSPTPLVPLIGPQNVLPEGMLIIQGASSLCAAVYDAWGLQSSTFLGKFALGALGALGSYLLPQNICTTLGGVLTGVGGLLDPSRLPIYLQFYPGGLSATDLNYYSTLMFMNTSAKITTFDYRKHQVLPLPTSWNLDHYGQETPLTIELESITTPMKLYYAKEDYMAPPQETLDIISRLPNAKVDKYEVTLDNFGHTNFITCLCQANKDVYNDIDNYFKQFK